MRDLPCAQLASYLEGSPLMCMMLLHLHVYLNADDDDDVYLCEKFYISKNMTDL